MTKFDYSRKPWWSFVYKSTMEALEDARMKISDIDAIVFTGMSSCDGTSEHQTHKVSLLSDLFKTNVPIIEIPSVCAGGGVAFWTALHLNNFKPAPYRTKFLVRGIFWSVREKNWLIIKAKWQFIGFYLLQKELLNKPRECFSRFKMLWSGSNI